ncbi:MAG: TetR/AcrR family transcriptional regulator [Cyclobacteriaceae bacterium]
MRYKEFNSNRVLRTCLKLFWSQGFNATGLNQIVKNTGVNRFSLYAEFENKEGLLYQTIQFYLEHGAYPKLACLEEGKTDALMDYLNSFFEPNTFQQEGCFLIFIGTEMDASNHNINTQLKAYLNVLHAHFQNWAKPLMLEKESILINQLTSFYCSYMTYGLILPKVKREDYLQKCLNTILLNTRNYA